MSLSRVFQSSLSQMLPFALIGCAVLLITYLPFLDTIDLVLRIPYFLLLLGATTFMLFELRIFPSRSINKVLAFCMAMLAAYFTPLILLLAVAFALIAIILWMFFQKHRELPKERGEGFEAPPMTMKSSPTGVASLKKTTLQAVSCPSCGKTRTGEVFACVSCGAYYCSECATALKVCRRCAQSKLS